VTIAQTEPAALEDPKLAEVESAARNDNARQAPTRALARLRFIRSHMQPFGVGVVALAAVVSVLGAVWAVRLGVSYPIAIMVSYCTLATTICLTAVLALLPKYEAEQEQPASDAPSVSEAWKHVSTFTVSDAARLWCEVEPGAAATQDIIAWARLLLDAIASGELACIRSESPANRPLSYPSDKPYWSTKVTRDALQAWARARGFNPGFLQDR
jgi:hypothetical protein